MGFFKHFLLENSYIDFKKYFYHCVRNDKDIDSIFKTGLKKGTNISTSRNGQAFEDEGGTILVFKIEDYVIVSKGYQQDGIVESGKGKPVAIIKDTSVDERDGQKLEDLADEYEVISKEKEKLAKELEMSLDKFSEILTKGYELRKKPEEFSDSIWKQSSHLYRKEEALFREMDKFDIDGIEEIEEVTAQDVLDRYKHYGVPVVKL